MEGDLQKLLQKHLAKHNLTTGQLAKLLKKKGFDVSLHTINNWVHGKTKRAQDWYPLLAIANVLNLTELEANQLLRASSLPPIDDLKASLTDNSLPDDERRKSLLDHWPFPTQAPKGLPLFVGRQEQIKTIETLLAQARDNLEPVTICIQGMGGVGKTVLAAHIVHRNRHFYHDGALWANLERAKLASKQENSAPEHDYLLTVLNNFARAYGEDVSASGSLQEKRDAVSLLLAGKQLLLVFDDVQDDEALAELLPLGEQTAVMITTRNKKLWEARHAPVIELGSFDTEKDESLQLAAHFLGPAVAEKNEAPLREIFDLIGHLPLAVDIVVNRLVKEVSWDPTRFCAQLRQEKRRLNELQFNQVGIRMSFNVSYQALSPEEQSFFDVLSVFRGEDFSVEAATYVAKISEGLARNHLSSLHVLSLLQPGRGSGRYRLHPLLREFGREKLKQSVAIRRMIGYFVKCVRKLGDSSSDEDCKKFDLDFEYSNVDGALEAAWEFEEIQHLVNGSNALFHYWETRGLYETARFHLDRAQEVARRLEDPKALVQTLHRRGKLAVRLGDYDTAEKSYREALKVAREVDDQAHICAVQQSLGALAARTGQMEQARDWTEKALRQAQLLRDANREFNLLNNLGGIMADSGKLVAAREYFEDALGKVSSLNGQSGSRRHCVLLQNLGRLASDQGDSAAAYTYFEEAWKMAGEEDDQARLCGLLDHMGYEDLLGDKFDDAHQKFEEGLDIARRIKSPLYMARHHSNLGLLKTSQGQLQAADLHFKDASYLFKRVNASWDLCQLYVRWGDCKALLDDRKSAEQLFLDAEKIAQENGFVPHIAHANWGLARLYAAEHAADSARIRAQESEKLFLEMGHRLATAVGNWRQKHL